jgi:16S rRNA (cytosine1402-N4)-methyltransferase
MDTFHTPVLLDESISGLKIKPGGDYVDATFGGGGHSKAILKTLGDGRLFGFDQDKDAAINIIDDRRFTFISHNFRFLKNFLLYFGLDKVDGILADLGVSSHDFDVPERGFSFRFESELDMRMNRHSQKTAAIVINTFSEEELIKIFREYGEITNARQLASAIVAARGQQPIRTTQQLQEIVKQFTPQKIENKFLAKVFQALRIEVNNEMEVLKEFLEAATETLKPGARLVVITYHSLEDRLVKNFMKAGNFEGKVEKDFYGNVQSDFRLINNKVITPGEDELNRNPRSRSAKLRIAERI